MIKAVFFDLFFTLIDFPIYPKDDESEFAVLNLSRKEWDTIETITYEERAKGKVNEPYDAMRLILKDYQYCDSIIKKATDMRISRIAKCMNEVEEDILNTIKTIRDKGIKVAIISNADIIDYYGWKLSNLDKNFDNTFFSCNHGTIKPEQKIFQLALDKMKVKADECVFVGDGGSNELRGARECGMKTIMMTQYSKKYWPEKIPVLMKDADYIVNSIMEILKYL